MTCNRTSVGRHGYIIVIMDYFMKWVEAIPTFSNDGKKVLLVIFNRVIAHFDVPKKIVTNHGNDFQNKMMSELALKLGFKQEHLSPYYPQENRQVEAVK